MHHSAPPSRTNRSIDRNLLLAALPATVRQRLSPLLRAVELPSRARLFEQGAALDAVFFPVSGWVSLLVNLGDGSSAEVGLVGREGMLGLPLLVGSARSPLEAMTQGAGIFLSLSTPAFHQLLEEAPAFRTRLLLYYQASFAQVSQTAVCNGRHGITQRLARWLLMTHDRAEAVEFPMTQELLALMLGVRRAGVSAAATKLKRSGLIHYGRGHVRISDRVGLENEACECYAMMQGEYRRLLSPAMIGKAA